MIAPAVTDKQLAEFREVDELKKEFELNAITTLQLRLALLLKHWSVDTSNDIRKMSPRELMEAFK